MTSVLVQMNRLGLGGTEINAIQFAAGVREFGYESHLYGPSDTVPDGPSAIDVAREYGIEIKTFERPSTAVAAARTMNDLAREVSADIVHVYGQDAVRGAYLGPCAFGRRPLVITAYEMAVNPTTLAGAPLIVGTRYLEEDHAARAGRTTLISPPIDTARDRPDVAARHRFRASVEFTEDTVVIGWVGRLDEGMKSPALRALIAAVDVLASEGRDVVLAIVGTGDAETDLRSLGAEVDTRHARRIIRFLGPVSDPHEAYAGADVSVGMGSSAGRALAHATPLVAVGERGWSAPFTETGADAIFRNSFWSDELVSNPVALLASHLRLLVDDPSTRARRAVFGREFALDHLSLPRMTERLADVYRDAGRAYGMRGWMVDVDLEIYAIREIVRTSILHRPPREGAGEYRFPAAAVPRLRARAAENGAP
ncbi:glycosyltransferase family 4 protein [Microbacterium sp. KUDC0406]|uniref:glycosyltransferase family 4 protein n=1 Tax=Microbacterium sp. KUDC0406 TaxID=2909588 RepID=UPI001F487E83|nr:glycosyltransferase family 4 protein [Microbacterium sp. KUDC0406]UJP08887.1 glycosyltransferase family 4 protein [Microbacterium sp. KUDC0406]